MTEAKVQTGSGKRVMQAHVALLFANIFWGMLAPVSKLVLETGCMSGLALSAIRIGGGALALMAIGLVMPGKSGEKEKIERRDIPKVIMASLLIIAANQGLYLLGLEYTNAIDSAVMCSLTPMATMILAAILLGNRITLLKGLGVVIGLVGVVMLVWGSQGSEHASNPLLGNALCLGAQVCAAVYFVVFKNLSEKYSAFTLTRLMFVISAIVYVPLCGGELAEVEWSLMTADVWMSIAFIVLLATAFAYATLPYSQKVIKPTVVSVYTYLQPVFAAILSLIIGVDSFGVEKAMATLLILGGVYLTSKHTK